MVNAAEISGRLSQKQNQESVLLELLKHASAGDDIPEVCRHVVRHILSSSSASNPRLLSLAYDLLLSIPSNPVWVQTLTSLAKSMSSDPKVAAVAMAKLPALPHPAVAHLALVATTPIVNAISNTTKAPVNLRVSAVHAAAAIALRARPLTAPFIDPIRLDALSESQLGVVRSSVSRALGALIHALDDPDDSVILAALLSLTEFALSSDSVPQSSVLRATSEATAAIVWDLLLPKVATLAKRLSRVLSVSGGSEPATSQVSETSGTPPVESRTVSPSLYKKRTAIRALARIAAHSLSGMSVREAMNQTGTQAITADMSQVSLLEDANAAAEESVRWAVSWTDKVLVPACDDADRRVASTACSSLLTVCSFCAVPAVADRRTRWGVKATTRLQRILTEHSSAMSSHVSSSLTKDAFRGLAALSKDPQIQTRFVVSTSIGLLPHAAGCQRVSERLEGLTVLANTVIEYDLSGREATVGGALTSLTASKEWRQIFALAKADGDSGSSQQGDSTTAAELVCVFAQGMLEASRKIISVRDFRMREALTQAWATMLAMLLQRTIACLSWTQSSSSSFAREMYLKMFEALGQYSAYLSRTRGGPMEEYERLQEMLVKAALSQNDVATRASLLACLTKYWIASALKAEANAGHMLKAIWRHAQEHFADEEILLKELRRGALWSDAQTGTSTPQERATEGGYVSFLTAVTKRTRAVVFSVSSSVTNVVETALFGSIALATSAEEGSTLTTDFSFSSLAALRALIHRNPTQAEKAIQLARRYVGVMQQAESNDLLVFEAVRNTIAGLEMYLDEFFPKAVPPRLDLADSSSFVERSDGLGPNDPHSFLGHVTESCVFASSRLTDRKREAATVSTEEAVLHASALSKVRMLPFHPRTLQNREYAASNVVERDHQTLNGAADPFGVIASHVMDTVKALASLRVEIVNRSSMHVTNATLSFTAGGALAPLPDATTSYGLGALAPGGTSTQRITLAVRHNQGFAGRVRMSIFVSDEHARSTGSFVEQSCLPYYIASSDVLLLRNPSASAGVDVFRRRWDLMREAVEFNVVLRQGQDLDSFVDTLERRSGCIRQVGRMQVSSHVSLMVSDSSREDYIALAALAPSARGFSGRGPCMVYVTIRSNSSAYCLAFRNECRDWLANRFEVVVQDEIASAPAELQRLQEQDARFTDDAESRTPYMRWRAAHAARIVYA